MFGLSPCGLRHPGNAGRRNGAAHVLEHETTHWVLGTTTSVACSGASAVALNWYNPLVWWLPRTHAGRGAGLRRGGNQGA
jgi:hypothetical protein